MGRSSERRGKNKGWEEVLSGLVKSCAKSRKRQKKWRKMREHIVTQEQKLSERGLYLRETINHERTGKVWVLRPKRK